MKYKTLYGPEPKPGDIITETYLGYPVTIQKIIYSDFWDRYGYDIELIDTDGNYRHWKQHDDGGKLQREKRLVNCYGSDCADLFEKYGML